MAMVVPLYLLISGDILYLGLGLVAMGVGATAWRARVGGAVAWSGVILALVSAVPVHPAAYATLLLVMAAWQVGIKRNAKVGRGMAMALLVVAIGIVLGALALRGYPREAIRRDAAVFVVGDSISAGLGASQEATWPRLLARRLDLSVKNLAWPGARLADGVSQARAIPQGPATVLVELGGNDLLGHVC